MTIFKNSSQIISLPRADTDAADQVRMIREQKEKEVVKLDPSEVPEAYQCFLDPERSLGAHSPESISNIQTDLQRLLYGI